MDFWCKAEGYSIEEIEKLEYPITGELQKFVREIKENIEILSQTTAKT